MVGSSRSISHISMKKQGRTGPRPLRSADELLAFSIICMILLDEVDGAGILEHAAERSDPACPSIWKLPLIELLLALPGFAKVTFAQGLLGADSAKSTTLLTLNLPSLPQHIRANAVSKELPKARSIGLDQDGHYRAAVLKEYPPALCRAMANSFAAFLQSEQMPDSRRSLPTCKDKDRSHGLYKFRHGNRSGLCQGLSDEPSLFRSFPNSRTQLPR